jgi:glycosyltransferase involved in cell wall biosynthesis
MRVLFVSAYGAWGRPASYIKSQSDSLRKKGIDVVEFYFEKRGLFGYLYSYCKLRNFLKKNKNFDIIHAHFGYTAFIVHLIPFASKFVISFMGDDLYGVLNEKANQTTRGKINILMAKYLQKRADWIIVKSKRMFDLISPSYKKITSILPNGVDFNKFPIIDQSLAKRIINLDSNKKHILFLGSPNEKRKNYKLVVKALKYLSHENVTLINPYPVLGEEVYLYLNACDVLVLASTMEGSPNVIKEAIVCNCPIVSTDVGDVSERINGIDGCYITGFDVREIATNINKAISFNARTNGRISSENIKTENLAAQLIDIYKKLL